MQVTIEIDELTAALLYANAWSIKGGKTLPQIIKGLALDDANKYQREFPEHIQHALDEFRQHQTPTPTPTPP